MHYNICTYECIHMYVHTWVEDWNVHAAHCHSQDISQCSTVLQVCTVCKWNATSCSLYQIPLMCIYFSFPRVKVHLLLSLIHIIDSPLMYTSLTFSAGNLRLPRLSADTASCRRKWRTMEEGKLLKLVKVRNSSSCGVYCVLSVHGRV